MENASWQMDSSWVQRENSCGLRDNSCGQRDNFWVKIMGTFVGDKGKTHGNKMDCSIMLGRPRNNETCIYK